MEPDSQSDVDNMENAQSLAKTGAKLGAAAGARFGPVATGVASGVGGAVGYLAGNAVDGAERALDEKRALTDGGQPKGNQESDESHVMIPVVEE